MMEFRSGSRLLRPRHKGVHEFFALAPCLELDVGERSPIKLSSSSEPCRSNMSTYEVCLGMIENTMYAPISNSRLFPGLCNQRCRVRLLHINVGDLATAAKRRSFVRAEACCEDDTSTKRSPERILRMIFTANILPDMAFSIKTETLLRKFLLFA
ncbi:hypothetical protein TNCV_138971 [Trichonephila clavipes]|nr:hypothetical protein TNCV_138971 [Trichonephila clavipes]